MNATTNTDKTASTDDRPDIDAIRKRVEREVGEIRTAGGKPVIRATDEGGEVARFDAREPFDIRFDEAFEAPTLLGTAATDAPWDAATFMGVTEYPEGWHFNAIEVVDGTPHHDAPRVSYHQGDDLAPVDRQAIPEGVRAQVDAYRDRAAELGAYEVEVRDRGEGVFEVVCRHAPDAGGSG